MVADFSSAADSASASPCVPNTKRVQVKKHGRNLSLEFTQEWGEQKRLKFEGFSARCLGLKPLFLYPITLRDPGFPLRNAALLFASASGIGLATVFTGIFALPSVEPIPSPTADQRILSDTSTNQVVTI
jgi:hypothetical protein